jgi:hypothetical protein
MAQAFRDRGQADGSAPLFRHQTSSPNGTPGARRRTTAVMRAWNIDGASMMTAATGGLMASPKVSKK